jgi:hypothetical protein
VLALVAVVIGLCSAAPAVADPPTGGPLPGAGYTYDQHWNCGAFSHVQGCYFPGTLGDPGTSYRHTWGWASADYDGGTDLGVRIDGVIGAICYICGQGNELVRACYNGGNPCPDQNATLFGISVGWFVWPNGGSTNANHTIYGHAEA